MKYFVNIKQPTYDRYTKELFYKRLMAKRLGKDNYTIHKNGAVGGSLNLLLDSSENLLKDYTIEFKDKLAFSKFKLSYKSLLNPSLENPSQIIMSCKSFILEDDYVDVLNELIKKYRYYAIIKERLAACEHTAARLIDFTSSLKYTYENFISSNKPELNEKYNIDENLFNVEKYKKLMDEVSKSIEDNNIVKSSYYAPSNAQIEINEQMQLIKDEAKQVFQNVVDLEIPTKK